MTSSAPRPAGAPAGPRRSLFPRLLYPAIFCGMLSFPSLCAAWDVVAIPSSPNAGEAFLVRVRDRSSRQPQYHIRFKDKEYPVYRAGKATWETFLPVSLEDAGKRAVRVRREAAGDTDERVIKITVRRKARRRVRLTGGNEKMRDAQAKVPAQNEAVLTALRQVSDTRRWSRRFIAPGVFPVITAFGVHRQGQTYSYDHRGIDCAAAMGTPVQAINDGVVVMSTGALSRYGDVVVIDHGQGVTSCFFHLSERLCAAGESVQRGAVVARVGCSGWATGPHLHWGVYVQGQAVDPAAWLALVRRLRKEERGSPARDVAVSTAAASAR